MTERLADLLTKATRERAQAYAQLAEARDRICDLEEDLRTVRLDLACARELLAYHGLETLQ